MKNLKKLKYNARSYTDKELNKFFDLDKKESKMLEMIGIINIKSNKVTNYAIKDDRKYLND